jgi:hypothetical protein
VKTVVFKELLPIIAFATAWLNIKQSATNHLSAFVPADITPFNISGYLQLQFFN